MNKELIETLASQVNAYFTREVKLQQEVGSLGTAATSYGDILSKFVEPFVANTAQPLLVTKEELGDLATKVFSHDYIQTFVFGLRSYALSVLELKDLKILVEGFAIANANIIEGNRQNSLSVLPADAVRWRVNQSELEQLYLANTWVIPLLALGYIGMEVE